MLGLFTQGNIDTAAGLVKESNGKWKVLSMQWPSIGPVKIDAGRRDNAIDKE